MINNGLLGCSGIPMTDDQCQAFMTFLLLEKNEEELASIQSQIENDPGYKIIKGRLEHAGGKASTPLICFLSFLSEGIPGHMVTWAYTLACMLKKLNKSSVDIEDFSFEFPYGIPSANDYDEVWDSQKVESKFPSSDNGYDDYKNWPTLSK